MWIYNWQVYSARRKLPARTCTPLAAASKPTSPSATSNTLAGDSQEVDIDFLKNPEIVCDVERRSLKRQLDLKDRQNLQFWKQIKSLQSKVRRQDKK